MKTLNHLPDVEDPYLFAIELAYKDLHRIDSNYLSVRQKAKERLAESIDKAKSESDHSVKTIADHFNKSRQAVNKVLTDVYGVRHEEKAKAARLGHKESRE